MDRDRISKEIPFQIRMKALKMYSMPARQIQMVLNPAKVISAVDIVTG